MKWLANAIAEKSCGLDFQGKGHCCKVKVRRNVTFPQPHTKMSLYTEYEMSSSSCCWEIALTKDFQVEDQCGQVKVWQKDTFPHPSWKWICIPNMKCLAQPIDETSREQDFPGGDCAKVKLRGKVIFVHPLVRMGPYTEYEMPN